MRILMLVRYLGIILLLLDPSMRCSGQPEDAEDGSATQTDEPGDESESIEEPESYKGPLESAGQSSLTGGQITAVDRPRSSETGSMQDAVALRIALHDGFRNDSLTLSVDGAELARREGVTTKRLLGYADKFQVEVPRGAISLKVEIPSRRISTTIPLQVSPETSLGLSIEGGEIVYMTTDRPFKYA